MATDKPPFKLTVSLEGYRPEAIHDALGKLDALCGEYDQSSGETKVKVTIEGYDEDALINIREGLEAFLRVRKTLVDGKVALESPVVRRLKEPTPMERTGIFDAIERLRPEPGSGVEAVEISAGGKSVTLRARGE